jgi:hypothetical protein
MLQTSYAIWGVIVIVLLIGFWILKRCVFRKIHRTADGSDFATFNASFSDHDIEHRALMFLVTQKTDSVLAALTRTIEQERQKLVGVVRKPSMTDAMDAWSAAATPVPTGGQSSYDRILPMVRDGVAVATIARQLQLPEAEVCMVMQLNAA